MSIRSRSTIGVGAVLDWAKSLPPGASVLDLGCGHGVPISKALIDAGFAVHGVDAAPSLIASFRARFPGVPTECAGIEDAALFGRDFDGVVAWGLIFLLAPDVQALLVHRVAGALRPGGRFLFTAPQPECEWLDSLTGQHSISLGAQAYRRMVEAEGLVLVAEHDDEGQNHYYLVERPCRPLS